MRRAEKMQALRAPADLDAITRAPSDCLNAGPSQRGFSLSWMGPRRRAEFARLWTPDVVVRLLPPHLLLPCYGGAGRPRTGLTEGAAAPSSSLREATSP